jgi:hypothetical protein
MFKDIAKGTRVELFTLKDIAEHQMKEIQHGFVITKVSCTKTT